MSWSVRCLQIRQGIENRNILAIHGLNAGLGSSDMLINAEMSIGKRTGAEFAEGAIKYESPIKLTKDSVVRARTMDGGQWSAGGAPIPVRPRRHAAAHRDHVQSAGPVSMSLWNCTTAATPRCPWLFWFDGIDFTFDGDAVIAPGQYIVLAWTAIPTRSSSATPGCRSTAGTRAACPTVASG